MLVYPAIDLKGGKCVRLSQGRPETEEVYDEDPVQVARVWHGKGARYLHIVDLDGAFEGRPVHLDLVRDIAHAVDIPIQLGGGIRRTEDVLKSLAAKVDRVVIGTRALEDPDWLESLSWEFPGKVVASVDAREEKVAVKGWKAVSHVDARDLVESLNELRLAAIIYTDISRDGMLTSVNFKTVEKMFRAARVPLIVAGGITTLDDVRQLRDIGVGGVIIGKALYRGYIRLEEAIRVAEEGRE